MIVQLDVPDAIDFQYVYRMVRTEPYQVSWEDDSRFIFLDSWTHAASLRGPLRSTLGTSGFAKAIAKLVTPARSLYTVIRNSSTVSYGWGTVGQCKYYKIEPGAVVIGPIWSDPAQRGKGLATRALQAAVNEYVRRGRSIFYIDTSKTNVSAQRVFQKSGFGDPVALYFRSFSSSFSPVLEKELATFASR